MRSVRQRLGVRRFCDWTVTPRRHGTDAASLFRSCSTAAGGAASSAATPLSSAPPSVPSSSFAASPTTPDIVSGTAALFDHYFSDVSTTLDIAPIKRPHVVGSLVCTLEEYPISIVLVEGYCGTSAEAVMERVRRCAVHSAQGMREVSRKSVKAFLAQHLCAARPNVVELLDALDLSLRVRLLRQDVFAAAAEEEEGTNRHERGGVSDVSSTQLGKSTTQRWRCSAELYDTWDTQPRFTPVEGAAGGGEGTECDEVGELLDVIGRALTRVEEQLRRLHARYASDSVEEACRFVQEAGSDFCDTELTRRCLGACVEGGGNAPHSANRHCPWWGEMRAHRSWSLHCDADMDLESSKAVGFYLCLTCTLHASCSGEANSEGGVTAVLQSSRTHRGLIHLVDNEAADGVPRRYANPASRFARLQDVYAASTLARISRQGLLSSARDWTCGPVDLTNHLVTVAATLSPTVAYDWIGATRGGSSLVNHEALTRAPVTVPDTTSLALPACVRWSSFVGRASLDDFAVHLSRASGAGGRSAAAGSYALPPLWPQLGLLYSGRTGDRCAALRELLRHEHGLRGLPRVLVEVCTTPPFSLEYDAELIVNDGDANSKQFSLATARDSSSIQVLCGDSYADVAAAAQVHAPWAAPLCKTAPAPLPVITTAAQRGRGDQMATSLDCAPTSNHPQDVASPTFDGLPCISVDVLSITDSMSAMGITSATWMARTAKLVATRGANSAPVVFEGANTLSGYRRMLRYCAKRPVYRTVHLPRCRTLKEALQRLLASMASSNSNVKDDFDPCTRGGDDWPDAHGEETETPRKQQTGVAQRRLGRGETVKLIFPFNAGAADVSSSTSIVHMELHRALFSAVQEHCRDSAQLRLLMSAQATAAEATFLHLWPLTARWLAPCGGLLHASLTPVVDEDAAAPRQRHGKTSAEEDVTREDAVVYDLRLSTTASTTASSVPVCGGARSCSAVSTAVVVTRLPASAAWLSTAHAAMRRALMLSQSDLFAPSDGHGASPTALDGVEGGGDTVGPDWLLVGCVTFTQAVEALLFTTTFSPLSEFNAQGFLKELFGHNVCTKKRGTATELWLVVAPHLPPVLLCAVGKREGKQGRSAEGKWLMLLRCVMDASCPNARATLEAMQHLQGRLSALTSMNDSTFPPLQCRLSCEWALRPVTVSETEPAEWVQVFVADLVRESPVPVRQASHPQWSRISMTRRRGNAVARSSNVGTSARLPPGVVHREEGPDSFGVLWRVLHCPTLLPKVMTNLSTTASGRGLPNGPIPSPVGFIKAAQRSLARQHGVARVTHRYDKRFGGVVVEGWGQLRQNGSEALCDTPITLVSEPMPLHYVPMRLMQLYHRLLLEAHELPRIPEEVWKQLRAECEMASTETILQSLSETLSCTPADLQSVETRFIKVWSVCLELPLRIFGFPASSASSNSLCCDAPPSLYVYCQRSSKRQAIRSVYVLLYQWTRYPQMEVPVNDTHFCVASYKSARWPSLTADSSSLSAPLSWSTSTVTAPPRSRTTMETTSCTPGARAVPSPLHTLPMPHSVLDASHARMEASLGALVNNKNGRVALRLSQTFGLQLMYGVSVAGVQEEARAADSVQLLREAWIPLVWAPAQILSAEVLVLQRLLTRSTTTSGSGDIDSVTVDMRDVLRELVVASGRIHLASLQSGHVVRAKEFCVSFFRRYFGWRVCERGDVEDISVADNHGSVVILQTVRRAQLDRGGHLCRPRRLTSSRPQGAVLLGEREHTTATLQLTQIVHGGKTSVRLGRVLVEVKGATPQTALDALWEQCTADIAAVFGVSLRMSPSEADDRVLHFMKSKLE
ncbi:conserved hypothetical protein [Leishmania braziliensis MHOM/BR/75/M2904]|uniref:Uncharacterized protein n=2 Tax=Leishmania braziliensis TaxID=5660 RepID=A4HEP2_LEIBR|nr:conserved hypothetical protein [Leishmania braziliensis MHOM/BR/75/M2904]CAJ2474530.1 unnamed protein product [Leishmania braziliensis]CAM39300.1 conserved hypothetical protein [Leishmania braziliensis MHOM/BR/75/M2904]SYZ66700.1 hypothetical_protein [Leishmania braziliensis MHOM/BR/75/M2904]